jgi:2-hydroxycyclohexanecarboxyl-CoA dehydrogenase
MRGLRDKVAIITGGGGGIGRAIVRRLADEGVAVAVLDRNADAARNAVHNVEASGGRAVAQTVDITDYAAVAEAVKAVEAQLGPADILVNNAGWDQAGNFLDTSPSSWEPLIAINLLGPLNLHHVVLKGMVARQRGRVVNIASDAARVGSSGEAVYAAAKAGVVAFTKTVARELAALRITLNVVCPGPTDTPLFAAFAGEGEQGKKLRAALERAIPFKRLGAPEDVAGIVAFLASDEAGYITGQVISVSGGLTMHG